MEFLYSILNIVLFLVMLGVLVTIHELGHFLVAKMFKVYVFEFAVGFGPKVFRKKKGETYYSLRALPLGGFVSMLGEEDSVPEEFSDVEIDKSRSLVGINRGKRAFIMSAGIIMNLVLGYGIFLFSNGVLKQTGISVKMKLEATSPLHALGVQDGDYFDFEDFTLDGYNLQSFGDGVYQPASGADFAVYVLFSPISMNNLSFEGKAIQLLRKDTTTLTNDSFYTDFKSGDKVTFTANFIHYADADDKVGNPYSRDITLGTVGNTAEGYKLGSLGFAFTKFTYRNNFVETFQKSNRNFVSSVTAVSRGIKSLFTTGLQNVSGPVGIFNMSASTLQNQGLASFLFLWGLISINLALFNLLPFPPLDGWHLLVVVVESITRQEISPKFKNVASLVGALLLILLTVAILAKDIIAIFGVLL